MVLLVVYEEAGFKVCVARFDKASRCTGLIGKQAQCSRSKLSDRTNSSIKMVSNIYLNDAMKTGRFLMRKADHVTRKRPMMSGKCLVGCLVLFACLGASSVIYGISTFMGDGLLAQSARLRAVKGGASPEQLPAGSADTEQLSDQPLARAAQEALQNDGRKPAKQLAKRSAQDERTRLIVLYSENSRINTGVWPGWGTEGTTVLNWAAAGVHVDKVCPLPCTFTHDNGMVGQADAVVVETVNHPKFGLGGQAFEWPAQSRPNPRSVAITGGSSAPAGTDGKALTPPDKLPAIGVFYYEPHALYPQHNVYAEEVTSHSDFTVVPGAGATLPISMVCPWGREVKDFLKTVPPKTPGRLLAYFSEHGVAQPFRRIVDELFEAAGADIHAYSHRRNRDTPAEAGGDPYQLTNRMDFVSTYRFILITDGEQQDDFLSPEWSQAFLSGTVPIYGGAGNAAHYAPGPRSFVSLSDFSSGAELWQFIKAFDGEGQQVEEAYERFFDWKKGAQAAFESDEGQQRYGLGTGGGIVGAEEVQGASQAVSRWPRPPAPGPGAEQQVADAREEASSSAFADASFLAWRNFRRHLDQCVHYAECRICDLVHRIT